MINDIIKDANKRMHRKITESINNGDGPNFKYFERMRNMMIIGALKETVRIVRANKDEKISLEELSEFLCEDVSLVSEIQELIEKYSDYNDEDIAETIFSLKEESGEWE